MPFAVDARLVAIEVPLRPEELIAAWRPDAARLVLPVAKPLRLQQRLAVRITLVGLDVAGTITGRVAATTTEGDVRRTELAPDEARVRAVEKLVAVARGEPVGYEPRAPRFLATIPAVVRGPGSATYMTTFSVSANGCGLAWTGAIPAVGTPLELRLGTGHGAVTFRGSVCWTSRTDHTATVGVRFAGGASHAWAAVVAEVRRSGALPS
jgi:hypothetical protein